MTLQEAALRYARRGVHVFPCKGKIPITSHGVKDATTNAEHIRAWWTRHPDATIAIATGASGLVVVDVDVKEVNGFDSLFRRMRDLGPLPANRIAKTPSGGQHWYCRQPDGVDIGPSCEKLGRGIDVRAGNSYVIAPPSHGYTWMQRGSVAPLPSTWASALVKSPRPKPGGRPLIQIGSERAERYCLAALDSACRELIATPKGQRNATLWNSAAAIGGLVHLGAFTARAAAESFEWACSHWEKRSPYKDRETVRRGLEFGLAHPRELASGGYDERSHAA